MDVFFLGAGKSYSGKLPSALKSISKKRKALDWQLQSLERLSVNTIHFIGGFHVQDIVEQYPQLTYTIVADWRNKNVVHTLIKAPYKQSKHALFMYSDTLFRPKTIEKFGSIKADIAVGVDSHWLSRFANRTENDISTSEVINLSEFTHTDEKVEFTGLLKFSKRALNLLDDVNPDKFSGLVSLIKHFHAMGFSIEIFDVKGAWTEFNSDFDIAHFILGTKAETLYRLYPLVKKSLIGQQVSFTVSQWNTNRLNLIKKIKERFNQTHIVVRSSSFTEDCWDESHAGGYVSVLNVDSSSEKKIESAVKKVISSYKKTTTLEYDQVLIQKCLTKAKMSGVVFTRSLETGAPYYRINFDDKTQSTESVTSGVGTNLRTVIVSKEHRNEVSFLSKDMLCLLEGVFEIEELLGYDKLDIEFAIDQKDQLHIFQVRPIAVAHKQFKVEDKKIKDVLDQNVKTFQSQQKLGPGQVGEHAFFGNMPDWNPAEIIGTKPKPLAYSLYRELIVDQVWAKQRSEFGYRDLTNYPLIRTFSGQPYVNIRNSFNSFIPSSVSDPAATRICNAYLKILKEKPHLHDKIEFAIAFTVLTPDFDKKAKLRFKNTDVTDSDIAELKSGLFEITINSIDRLSSDIASLVHLSKTRKEIIESDLTHIEKALMLLDECINHGTLAFSHAARAGFVAMTFLNNLVDLQVINKINKEQFLNSFITVAGEFERDAQLVIRGKMSKIDFVEAYGHLRPGTYDIAAKAYWENPEKYLYPKISKTGHEFNSKPEFRLSESQYNGVKKVLSEMQLSISPERLFEYCKRAIQAREYVKFEFSKNLSKALDFIVEFGKNIGLKRKSLAFLSVSDLREYSLNVQDLESLKRSIKSRKERYAITEMIELPQVIFDSQDFYGFERNASEPNYITSKSIERFCINLDEDVENLDDKIVFIEQADPGYDWMFAYNIAGLITKYGGANSHMAIRSAELNLPAAIGVGDKIYDELKSASIIKLNCGQKQIIRIK